MTGQRSHGGAVLVALTGAVALFGIGWMIAVLLVVGSIAWLALGAARSRAELPPLRRPATAEPKPAVVVRRVGEAPEGSPWRR